jgi:predicted small secreted protein
MKTPKHIAAAILLAGFGLLAGCATFDGIGFGLDVANADTTISLRHADGKSVVAAEQGGNRIGFNLRR